MDREALRKYAEKVIIEKNNGTSNDKISYFNKLWSSNIVDQERLLKGAINHYYDNIFKENDHNTKDSIMDTAIHFEISSSCVKNVIYKYRHVILNI